MNKIFHLILNLVEYFYKKKLIKKIKKYLPTKIKIFFDIGAHKGETTIDFSKNFLIEEAYLFEPLKKNFDTLKDKLNYKNRIKNINKFNFALGDKNEKIFINEALESSSSTINEINTSSRYFKRKEKIIKFFNKNAKVSKSQIVVKKAKDFILEQNISSIDFIKLDTEGYEFIILNDLGSFIKNVKLILFEHHYDLMIRKKYKFNDLHNLLFNNNFEQVYKSKMYFRKSFEYIYLNKNYKFD